MGIMGKNNGSKLAKTPNRTERNQHAMHGQITMLLIVSYSWWPGTLEARSAPDQRTLCFPVPIVQIVLRAMHFATVEERPRSAREGEIFV